MVDDNTNTGGGNVAPAATAAATPVADSAVGIAGFKVLTGVAGDSPPSDPQPVQGNGAVQNDAVAETTGGSFWHIHRPLTGNPQLVVGQTPLSLPPTNDTVTGEYLDARAKDIAQRLELKDDVFSGQRAPTAQETEAFTKAWSIPDPQLVSASVRVAEDNMPKNDNMLDVQQRDALRLDNIIQALGSASSNPELAQRYLDYYKEKMAQEKDATANTYNQAPANPAEVTSSGVSPAGQNQGVAANQPLSSDFTTVYQPPSAGQATGETITNAGNSSQPWSSKLPAPTEISGLEATDAGAGQEQQPNFAERALNSKRSGAALAPA